MEDFKDFIRKSLIESRLSKRPLAVKACGTRLASVAYWPLSIGSDC